MNKYPTICLIGDIMVDVTLKSRDSDVKLRLGGIVHAARTLWALGVPYDVGYFAPTYLDYQIKEYLIHHGCINITKLGDISGAPYVFLIQEAKEIGSQGYEFLLRDELKLKYNKESIEQICKNAYKDYVLISGNYDLLEFINLLPNKIHIDVANDIQNITDLQKIKRKISTFFVSTSSNIFENNFENNFMDFVNQFENYVEEIILKENRGGSRGYNFSGKKSFHAYAQPRKISHSIGVGDAFDITYLSTSFSEHEQQKKIVLSSWIAAEYAVTSFPDDFKLGVSRVLKSDINDLINLKGVSLPWEMRKVINIYIAAPDFTFVNTTPIDVLEAALRYHNFTPRRPIKENGQMEKGATKQRKQELVAKDIQILDECSLMVAVLLYDDPGTLIELGYASAKGMPVILYDPYRAATNCMLTELPDLVSDDLDEVITEIFIKSANLSYYEK